MKVRLRFSVLVGIFFISQAGATSFISKSFPDSVKEAPNIVRGVIGMSYADQAKSGEMGKRIYTFYELTPSEVFKGSIPLQSITVRQLGGEKEGVVMDVPGVARFSRGEEVVVLLSHQNPDGSYDIRGLMMGKFSLQKLNGKEYLVGAGAIRPDEVEKDGIAHVDGERGTTEASSYSIEDLRQLIKKEREVVAAEKNPSPDPTPQETPKASWAEPSPAALAAPSSEVSSSSPGFLVSKGVLLAAGILFSILLLLFLIRS